MRRIFSELLPPDELGAPATARLLARFGLQVLVALPPSAQTPAMGRALAGLAAAGVPLGIWPLLPDAEGYWPSDGNFEAFARRVRAALAFAEQAGAPASTVVVDLEPPLHVMHAFFDAGAAGALGTAWRRLLDASRPPEARRREVARAGFAALHRELAGRGVETYATVIPPVVLDVPGGRGVWQAILQTQALSVGWARVSPMLYTSVMTALLPSGRAQSAQALAFELARRTQATCGPRAAAALGLAGHGKLGTEPVLADPEALAADVGAVRAAGVEDLALFSLEGVLARRAPERWLGVFTGTEPRPPPAVWRGAWRLGLMCGRMPSSLTRML